MFVYLSGLLPSLITNNKRPWINRPFGPLLRNPTYSNYHPFSAWKCLFLPCCGVVFFGGNFPSGKKNLPKHREEETPNLPNQKAIEGSIQVQRLCHKAYASSRKNPRPQKAARRIFSEFSGFFCGFVLFVEPMFWFKKVSFFVEEGHC